MIRIVFHLALICSVLFLPWWMSFIFALVSVFMVERFYEVVLYGMLFDVLYGTEFGISGIMFLGTLCTTGLFCTVLVARNRLAF